MLNTNEVFDILDNITYKNWDKEILPVGKDLTLFRWFWEDPNEGLQQARFWVVDHTQPHSDIVRTALAAVIMAEEHEARESFRYKGKKIFNPHYDVDRLAEIAGKLENLEIPQR